MRLTLFTTTLLLCFFNLSAQEPIASYDFFEDATDASGNQFNGEIVGASFCEGQNGENESAIFFGGNDYVNVGDNLDFGTGDFSISIWVNVSEFEGLSGGNNGGKILNKGLSSIGEPSLAGYGIRALDQNNQNTLRFEIGGELNGIQFIDFTEAVVDTWYHLVCLRTNNQISMFVDCELVSTIDLIVPELNVDTNLSLTFGCTYRGPNDISTFYNGKLDNCKIYDFALSETEIFTDCEAASVNVENTSIKPIRTLYPNPTSDFVNISGNQILNNTYTVSSLDGKQLMRSKLIGNQINVGNLNPGLYMITVTNSQGEISTRSKIAVN